MSSSTARTARMTRGRRGPASDRPALAANPPRRAPRSGGLGERAPGMPGLESWRLGNLAAPRRLAASGSGSKSPLWPRMGGAQGRPAPRQARGDISPTSAASQRGSRPSSPTRRSGACRSSNGNRPAAPGAELRIPDPIDSSRKPQKGMLRIAEGPALSSPPGSPRAQLVLTRHKNDDVLDSILASPKQKPVLKTPASLGALGISPTRGRDPSRRRSYRRLPGRRLPLELFSRCRRTFPISRIGHAATATAMRRCPTLLRTQRTVAAC